MLLMLCILVMGELNISFIETVILSVPDDRHTLEHIQPLWSALEEQVSRQRVYSLGVSDLSKVQLEELYNWAMVCDWLFRITKTVLIKLRWWQLLYAVWWWNTLCLKKTVQNCFCQNFVKFPPISIIFDRMIAKRLKLCEMRSFPTSPNSRHHTTMLNAHVPNCYINYTV